MNMLIMNMFKLKIGIIKIIDMTQEEFDKSWNEINQEIEKHNKEIEKAKIKLQLLIDKKSDSELSIDSCKALIDKIFSYEENINCNMIVLQSIRDYDGFEMIDDAYQTYNSIEWEWDKYNKLCYPISIYDEEDDEQLIDEEKLTDINKVIKRLLCKIPNDIDITDTNELWYKVFAVTKDYKIVSFIIRYDGMLSNSNKIHVISTF